MSEPKYGAGKNVTTWSYMMCKESAGVDYFYSIREVYKDKEGNLSWTENSVKPYGDTLDEIKNDLVRFVRAMDGPILDLTKNPPAVVERNDSNG